MKALILVLLATALACSAAPTGVTEISAENLLASPPRNAVILDVRTAQEFASGHVPNAINIPHDELASRIQELPSDMGTPVVVYCRSGGRAGKAASVLGDAGFADILHLTGDMSDWNAKGRPTEKP